MVPPTSFSDAQPAAAAAPAPREAAAGAGAAAPRERRLSWVSRCKFWIVRTFLWGLARLLSLRGLYLFGRAFGTLEYWVNFKRRARYRRELQRVFPEGISRARENLIIRSYFRRTRCDKLLYLIFDKLPKEKLLRRIRFHGREWIDAGLERGNGVFALLSHNGSHHIAGLLMALLGYKVAGVRDRNEGALRVFMQEAAAASFPELRSIRMLFADSFPRDIYRCFRDNFVLGAALDVSRVRGQSLKTCPVTLFGESREFLTGTAQIALRSGTTIVPGFVVSRPNFYFRLIVRPPLFVPGQTDEPERPEILADLMQRYADEIAAHVREHPDHLSRI